MAEKKRRKKYVLWKASSELIPALIAPAPHLEMQLLDPESVWHSWVLDLAASAAVKWFSDIQYPLNNLASQVGLHGSPIFNRHQQQQQQKGKEEADFFFKS